MKGSLELKNGREEGSICLRFTNQEVKMLNFFPELLITYFTHFRQAFSVSNFLYFQGFIFAALLSDGRKCITRIADVCFFIDKSLASWEYFMAQSHWDSMQVARQLTRLCVKELSEKLRQADVSWQLTPRMWLNPPNGCWGSKDGRKPIHRVRKSRTLVTNGQSVDLLHKSNPPLFSSDESVDFWQAFLLPLPGRFFWRGIGCGDY